MAARRPGDYVAFKGKNITVVYRPANTKGDLQPGSRAGSMKEFLLSDRIADVLDDAADDIAAEAKHIAMADGAMETGDYANSFTTKRAGAIVIAGNARRSVHVVNEDESAAANEFGNSKRAGRRTLARAGEKFHTPKGIA